MNHFLSDFRTLNPLHSWGLWRHGPAYKEALLTFVVGAAALLSFFLTGHSCR